MKLKDPVVYLKSRVWDSGGGSWPWNWNWTEVEKNKGRPGSNLKPQNMRSAFVTIGPFWMSISWSSLWAVYWTPVTAYPTPWPFTKDTKILAFANLEVTCAGVAQATSRGSGVALFTTLSPWNQIRTMLSSPLSWKTKRSFGSHLLLHQGKTHQSNRFKFLRSARECSITSVGFPSVLHWSFALSFSLTPLFYLELSYKLYAFR